MLFFKGELHSPFFIYIRCSDLPSDNELLEVFGLSDYQLSCQSPIEQPSDRPYALIGNSEDWILLADDWNYTLWYKLTGTDTVSEYASTLDGEVFIYRMPDVDDTFEFHYWKGGDLVRSLNLTFNGWCDPPTLTEVGKPFSFEAEVLNAGKVYTQVPLIAKSLAFNISEAKQSLRIYEGAEMVHELGPYENVITNIPREDWEKARERNRKDRR